MTTKTFPIVIDTSKKRVDVLGRAGITAKVREAKAPKKKAG